MFYLDIINIQSHVRNTSYAWHVKGNVVAMLYVMGTNYSAE